jgi:hypothetical protein
MDIGTSGRTFGVCREHRWAQGPPQRAHRLIGTLVEQPQPKAKARSWRALLRRPRPNVAPKVSIAVVRKESVRSSNTAVAALASLAIHRPASPPRKGPA